MDRVLQVLKDGKDVRNVDWNAKEVYGIDRLSLCINL